MKRLLNNINVYERLRKLLGPYLFLTILSASNVKKTCIWGEQAYLVCEWKPFTNKISFLLSSRRSEYTAFRRGFLASDLNLLLFVCGTKLHICLVSSPSLIPCVPCMPTSRLAIFFSSNYAFRSYGW